MDTMSNSEDSVFNTLSKDELLLTELHSFVNIRTVPAVAGRNRPVNIEIAYCDKCDWYLAANTYGNVRAGALSHEKAHRHIVAISEPVYTATCKADYCFWTRKSSTLENAQRMGHAHEERT